MTDPVLTVVIPAYNAAKTITAQLDALRAQEGAPAFEVVVADNRSTDATADTARASAHALDLRVVPAMDRQGVNCARNAGVRAARGAIIVFLDADDRARPDALRAFVAEMDREPSHGIVGGLQSEDDPATFELPVPQKYLPFALGGFMAVRRQVFEVVGEFDEDFVGGHDEVDLCWRAQHAGFGIGIARDAVLDRTERATALQTFRQWRGYGFTYVQLYVKHRSRGIEGSSLLAEKPLVKRVLKQIPRVLRGDSEDRLDAAGFIGWQVGRWLGDARFRTWGPK